jgi:hypothetical protein
MNIIMNQKNSNLLQNIDNYHKILTSNNNEIFTKYITLIELFLRECSNNVSIHDITYYKYVLCKGIETLSHVFNFLLLYTNNLELTFSHTKQAFCYYIEFIGQIGDDNHGFLQLNSNDAILFVYKKTIFDINNEHRKDFIVDDKNKNKININEMTIKIYNNIINTIIVSYPFTSKNNSITSDIYGKLNKLLSKMMHLNLAYTEIEYIEKLEVIEYYLTHIIETYNDEYFTYIDLFLKKLKNNNITIINLKKKINKYIFQEKLQNTTPSKFINWLYDS